MSIECIVRRQPFLVTHCWLSLPQVSFSLLLGDPSAPLESAMDFLFSVSDRTSAHLQQPIMSCSATWSLLIVTPFVIAVKKGILDLSLQGQLCFLCVVVLTKWLPKYQSRIQVSCHQISVALKAYSVTVGEMHMHTQVCIHPSVVRSWLLSHPCSSD